MQFTVRAPDLATLLDRAPPGVTALSLDCFDTLVWRTTHSPSDIFAALDLPGGAMGPRIWAEGTARRVVQATSGAAEIALADVYRQLHPRLAPAEIDAAVDRELAIETDHCFAFTPAVALIEDAKRRGLTVIVVSDMYLSETQLRAHIVAAGGAALLAMIDHVFVSNTHGLGKNDGLFDRVLATLDQPADTILHVGDNHSADYVSAARHGLHAVHFEQFDAESEKRLRLEAVAAVMIDPAVRVSRPVLQPHRAAVALRPSDDAAVTLGQDVVGPAMHAFASWLKAEIDAMAARLGRPVRPLFLMRDGYLPFRAFATLYPEAGAAPVEISRFVATRASLHDDGALDRYIGAWLHRLPLPTLAKQLMLFGHEWDKIARLPDKEARAALARAVRKPDLRRKLLLRAQAFGAKLAAHLAGAGVAPGDAVMLVDIGYNGSVQNLLTPMLESRLGLTVAGRYLFLREGEISGLDKRGMIDVRSYDARTLHALSTNVVVLEQLCNVAQGSTIDFDAAGVPIREAVDAKARQAATRDAVQAACLDYVRDAGRGVLRPAPSDDLDARVRAAAATLARLFFMPNAREVALLDSFAFDANMGSGNATRLFDPAAAGAALRRHGAPYINGSDCMYLPGEIHAHGLPLALTLFTATRFALDLRSTDFETGGVEVPVLMMGAEDGVVRHVTAHPTADGFYRLRVPVGARRVVPAVQLGQACEWVQIEEVAWQTVAELSDQQPPRAAAHLADAMEAMAPDLYRAEPTGVLVAPPPGGTEPVVLSIVFRPVRWRTEAAQARLAA